MSSHREAPEISKDPVADSTDTYAFMSPNRPGFVSIITNYIPLQNPAGGPNFFEFGDDVDYQINIDNNGDGRADIVYDFRFTTTIRNPNTFLYNTGTIDSLTSPNFNRPQTYTMTTWRRHHEHEHEHDHDDGLRQTNTVANVPVPPCNIGPLSTPNYGALAASAVQDAGRWHAAVRRTAARWLLRRPGCGVRLGRPAAVPATARRQHRRPPTGRRRAAGLQRALHRHRGARPTAHSRWQSTHRTTATPTPRSGCGHRPAGRRPLSATPTVPTGRPARWSRCHGSATRSSTRR